MFGIVRRFFEKQKRKREEKIKYDNWRFEYKEYKDAVIEMNDDLRCDKCRRRSEYLYVKPNKDSICHYCYCNLITRGL